MCLVSGYRGGSLEGTINPNGYRYSNKRNQKAIGRAQKWHTTPVLRRNVSLRNWERNLRRQNLHSGSGIEDSPITEGLPFTIRVPDSARSLGEAWYHVMVVEVVECNESEPMRLFRSFRKVMSRSTLHHRSFYVYPKWSL